jgi:hypothetical protein
MELALQPGLSLSQRSLHWMYQAPIGTFTATANLEWNVSAVALSIAATPITQVTNPSLECVLTARLQLTTRTFPGPGLSGGYAVIGTLSITPDPWVHFGLTPPTPAAAVDTPTPSPAPAAGGHRRLAGAHNRHLHQGGAASAEPVNGWLQVVELTPNAASSAADAARGDGTAWADGEGQVTVTGAANIPASQLPAWKATGVTSGPPSKAWPPWLYVVVGFAGVAAVNVCVVVCWLLLQRWASRRQAAGQAAAASSDTGCVVNAVPQGQHAAAKAGAGGMNASFSSGYGGGVREPVRALSPTQVTPRMAWEPAEPEPAGNRSRRGGRSRR